MNCKICNEEYRFGNATYKFRAYYNGSKLVVMDGDHITPIINACYNCWVKYGDLCEKMVKNPNLKVLL